MKCVAGITYATLYHVLAVRAIGSLLLSLLGGRVAWALTIWNFQIFSFFRSSVYLGWCETWSSCFIPCSPPLQH